MAHSDTRYTNPTRTYIRYAAAAFIAAAAQHANAQFYDFDTDGQAWPPTIVGAAITTTDGVFIANITPSQKHKIDTNYATDPATGLANASRLTNNAWYGRQEDSRFILIEFFAQSPDFPHYIAFDYATSEDTHDIEFTFQGVHADPFNDTDPGLRTRSFPLNETFETTAGHIGRQGRIEINAIDFNLKNMYILFQGPFSSTPDPATAPPVYVAIDNIAINQIPIPEPATILLLLTPTLLPLTSRRTN